MKNKFLKISSLILSLGMLVCSFSNAFAGVGASRPKKTPESHKRLPPMSVDLKRAIDIWANQLKYSPMYAEDGGKAYFWSWNGVKCKEDFDAFVKKYKAVANNTTSAQSLPNSERNENWATFPSYGNSYTLESFEESKDPGLSKYLLRIDEENNLIYTVRKSGDLYLFTFYLASCIEPTDAKLCLSCFAVSSDMRNIKNILLPVDKELFD